MPYATPYIDQTLRIGAREQAQEQERYIASHICSCATADYDTFSCARARHVALILETACRRVLELGTSWLVARLEFHANTFVAILLTRINITLQVFLLLRMRRCILISTVIHRSSRIKFKRY